MTKGKEVAVQESKGFIEAFKNNAGSMLQSYFGNEQKVGRFYAAMNMCFAKTPKLKECSPESLSTVFMTCAEVQLYPSGYTGECYVIPYSIKGKMTATFQLGYQGMITLAYRAGVKHIDAQTVYEKDKFEYEYGLNPQLIHVPDKFSEDRGNPIGAYAVATLDSGIQKFEIMSEAEIYKHRAKSQSWSSGPKYSPWNPDNDPQLIMWRKTVLKQLFKMLPKSSTLQQAVNADTQGDIIDMSDRPAEPTEQDRMQLVADAHAYLEEIGVSDPQERAARINVTVSEVMNGEPLMKADAEQMDEIKKRLFTGEVIDGETVSETDKPQGELL